MTREEELRHANRDLREALAAAESRLRECTAQLVTARSILTEKRKAKEAGDKLLSSVLSVRKSNTDEWMNGIADDVNAYAEETGERDRVRYDGDGLKITKLAGAKALAEGGA